MNSGIVDISCDRSPRPTINILRTLPSNSARPRGSTRTAPRIAPETMTVNSGAPLIKRRNRTATAQWTKTARRSVVPKRTERPMMRPGFMVFLSVRRPHPLGGNLPASEVVEVDDGVEERVERDEARAEREERDDRLRLEQVASGLGAGRADLIPTALREHDADRDREDLERGSEEQPHPRWDLLRDQVHREVALLLRRVGGADHAD